MHRLLLVAVATAICCSPAPEDPPEEPAPVRSLCMQELEPGRTPVMMLPAGDSCGSALEAPCELEADCGGRPCTCTCDADPERGRGDCRGTETAVAQRYYAGQLPAGWSFECRAERCVWVDDY